jgi:hypothetical protein
MTQGNAVQQSVGQPGRYGPTHADQQGSLAGIERGSVGASRTEPEGSQQGKEDQQAW